MGADRRVHVLVVEDTPSIAELLVAALGGQGLDVELTVDGAGARASIAARRPDVVVLDLELPDVSGFDLLRDLVSGERLPVVVVSGRGAEMDRVVALELGAEDYVVKPFLPRELAARVRRVARRTAPPSAVEHEGLAIDPDRREVRVEGRPVELTAKEFDLLHHLVSRPGRTIRREELLRDVWQSSPEWQNVRTVTEHVRRLRLKLGDHPESPRWIKTVSRVGYRFDP